MSRYADNLGRAARTLKRLGDIGGPSEIEGVSLKEIINDVLEAQNRAFMDEALRRVSLESSLQDNVVDLHGFSRKVGS